jgi:hypothetical protein
MRKSLRIILVIAIALVACGGLRLLLVKPPKVYELDLRQPPALGRLEVPHGHDVVELHNAHVRAILPNDYEVNGIAQSVFVEVRSGRVREVLIRIGPETFEAIAIRATSIRDALRLQVAGNEEQSRERLEAWKMNHGERGEWPSSILGTVAVGGATVTVTVRASFDESRPWLMDVLLNW